MIDSSSYRSSMTAGGAGGPPAVRRSHAGVARSPARSPIRARWWPRRPALRRQGVHRPGVHRPEPGRPTRCRTRANRRSGHRPAFVPTPLPGAGNPRAPAYRSPRVRAASPPSRRVCPRTPRRRTVPTGRPVRRVRRTGRNSPPAPQLPWAVDLMTASSPYAASSSPVSNAVLLPRTPRSRGCESRDAGSDAERLRPRADGAASCVRGDGAEGCVRADGDDGVRVRRRRRPLACWWAGRRHGVRRPSGGAAGSR